MSSRPAPLPPVVILCGGAGTRLREHAPSIPKPLVEIGGKPILWHVIQIYVAQGFTDVLLLTGFRGELIERFVSDESWPRAVTMRCLETGVETPTGGRLRQASEVLGPGTICVTYADGVADIDLHRLLADHGLQRAPATMTVVRPEMPFGVAELNGDGTVRGFQEKPRSEYWINGGFFCFEREVLEQLHRESALEREPLARLAASGGLRAFRHEGFWACMDTYKDAVALNELWAAGQAPWKLWS
jgi:glucose-1-phosphate cytidylyltransferase